MDIHKTVVVIGATDKQGGAVARHLLAAGFRVRAVTRDPNSERAEALASLGADLVQADLDRVVTLGAALTGAYGVFSVQDYWEKDVGYEGEVRQGKAVADAAKRAGIKHFVQSTMAEAPSFAGVEHFASKKMIEAYVKELGLPYTLIGTVYFMDNLLDPNMGGKLTFPVLAGTLGRSTPFQLLAVDDIGAVTAEVFKQPTRFMNQRVDLVGDTLTVAQMKAAYERVSGKRPKAYRVPAWALRLMNKEFAAQLRWHNKEGWSLKDARPRADSPSLTSFEAFLRRHNVSGL